jgi:hypothetical protein
MTKISIRLKTSDSWIFANQEALAMTTPGIPTGTNNFLKKSTRSTPDTIVRRLVKAPWRMSLHSIVIGHSGKHLNDESCDAVRSAIITVASSEHQ